MADIRIKDLTTTASSTASDDFIAVDGTTNGTRKLNAFSPTFGGNVVVTGTLTVSGATGSLGSSASAATSLKLTVGVGTNASPKYRTIDFRNYDDSKSQAYIRAANRETDSNASTIEVAARSSGDVLTSIATFSDSQLSIAATTASTTTSTGALVVSGGVGVGGAIVAGGTITSTASTDSGLLQLNLVNSSTGTSASSLFRFNAGTRTATLQAYNDTHATLAGQLRVGTSNGDIVLIPSGVAAATFGASSISLGALSSATTIIGGDTGSGTNILLLKDGLGTLKVNFKGNGDVAVLSSTASTSTSSGALVVSGGVGVAGAIYAGGYASTASHARIGASGSVVALSAANNVDSGLPAAWNGNYGLGVYYSAASTNTILMGDGSAGTTIFATRTGSANTSRITIDNTNGNTTFAGAISIGNTVNTVSPTSPNRTITMVIGGTTYYLAAKTTND